MSKKKKRYLSPSRARNTASYIFSFLLSLTFLAMGLLGLLRLAVTDGQILSVFDSTYVGYVHTDLENEILDYTLPTGIPVEVVSDLISEERVAYDLQISLANEVQNRSYDIYTGDIAEMLSDRVTSLYREQGTEVDADLEKIIDRYTQDICEIYVDDLKVPGFGTVLRIITTIRRLFPFVMAGLAIFAVILIVLCIRLHSWIHRGLRYVAFAAGGAALMTMLAPLLVWMGDAYRRLQISPQYVYYALTEYIERLLKYCFVTAAAWLAVTVLLGILIALLRKKAMKH